MTIRKKTPAKKRKRGNNKVISKKFSFSKIVIATFFLLVVFGNLMSYSLSRRGYENASDVSISLNEVFGGVLIGYFIRNAAEHNSLNKNGLIEIDEDDAV